MDSTSHERYITRTREISVEEAQRIKDEDVLYATQRRDYAQQQLDEAIEASLVTTQQYQEAVTFGHPDWDIAQEIFKPELYHGDWNFTIATTNTES